MGKFELENDVDTLPCYRLFGVTLASSYPFSNQLVTAVGPAQLSFTCLERAPGMLDYALMAPDFVSPHHTPDGQSLLHVFHGEGFDLLHFLEVADFYIWPDRIVCNLLDPAFALLVEIHFLGRVMAYWLERHGILALHAAAVVVEGRAVAFLESNGGGKSTMAANLVRYGYPLLTDDILPVEKCDHQLVGHAAYPQMRMWPEQAEYFLGHYASLPQIHPDYPKRRVPVGPTTFGNFCEQSQPLGCIYIPERREPSPDSTIQFAQLSPFVAMSELMRHSFIEDMLTDLSFQQQRLPILAKLVRDFPVRRISYPSDYNQLQYVYEAILEDCLKQWANARAEQGSSTSKTAIGHANV